MWGNIVLGARHSWVSVNPSLSLRAGSPHLTVHDPILTVEFAWVLRASAGPLPNRMVLCSRSLPLSEEKHPESSDFAGPRLVRRPLLNNSAVLLSCANKTQTEGAVPIPLKELGMPQGRFDLKAVIFDFDGVLVDSEPLHYKAFCEVLKPLGLSPSYDVYVERYIGFDDRDAFRAMFQDAGKDLDPDLFERLLLAKEAAFHRIVAEGVVPFAGARELVEDIQRAGLPLAIASGAKTAEIRMILRSLGMLEAFSVIVSADDVRAGKPHPETYERALKALYAMHPALRGDPASDGTAPSGVVVLEDTPTGIQAARSAGLFVVAVAHTYPMADLQQAHWVVPRLADLSLSRLRQAAEAHASRPDG